MARFVSAGLYVVTSSDVSGGRATIDIVRRAIAGGATLFQLREKRMSTREFVAVAGEALRLIRTAGGLLIINDRLDAAMAVDADGVHLGQEDLPVEYARKIAPGMIIGASSHSVGQAKAAENAGASYVNIGPIYPTRTKNWSGPFLGIGAVAGVAGAVSIPFTVMGGIKKEHIPDLVRAGARTIAVVTAVTEADDPGAAAGELIAEIAREREQVEAVDSKG